MKVSIIIRTKNEAKKIGDVLNMLSSQTEKDFEVVIVDSGSTDGTLDILEKYRNKLHIKALKIKPKEFTYPHACNLGAEKALGKFLVYLSGHSVPINERWLELGLKNFDNKKVAGVYSRVIASSDASFWERILYLGAKFNQRKNIVKALKMGILGNTNAIIKREIWQKHHFDESYSDGGEDGEMAKYILENGYIIIDDPAFAVKHSHGLGLIAFVKQYSHWYKLYQKFKGEQ